MYYAPNVTINHCRSLFFTLLTISLTILNPNMRQNVILSKNIHKISRACHLKADAVLGKMTRLNKEIEHVTLYLI